MGLYTSGYAPATEGHALTTNWDEGNEKVNYINVVTKKIVINNHKYDRKGTKIINIIDNELNDILCRGKDKYLITNHSGKIYTSSSSFF